MRMILIAAIGSPRWVSPNNCRRGATKGCLNCRVGEVLMETTPEGEQKWWTAVEQEGSIRIVLRVS